MRDYRYLVELEDDPDGDVIATFPDVPEAITVGKDHTEATAEAAEALGLALRGYLVGDRDLPAVTMTGEPMVAPHTDDILKLVLVETVRSRNITPAEFKALSGLKDWEVAALFDPDGNSTITAMEHALALLGRRLHISVEAA